MEKNSAAEGKSISENHNICSELSAQVLGRNIIISFLLQECY